MNIATLIPNLIPTLIAIALLILIILAALIARRRLDTQRLRKKFGPEYDYTVQKLGDQQKAQQSLLEREKRVVQLDIQSLGDSERERYDHEWTELQVDFVDDPKKTVEKANRLVTEVMIARGYPIADFEHRAEDLSVTYPNLVSNYRDANSITMKSRDDGSSTEELRQAMIDYHSLFEQLMKNNPRIEKVKVK